MRKHLLGLFFLLLSALPALAANCVPFTYTLTNGTTADANQVMANFNLLLNCSNNNLAHSGVNSDITALTGITTPLSVPQGGTGFSTLAANAVLVGNGGSAPTFSALTAPTSCSITDASGASLLITTNYCSYSVFNGIVTVFGNITYPVTADGGNASIFLPVSNPNHTQISVLVTDTANQDNVLGVIGANGTAMSFYSFSTSAGTVLTNANRSTKTMAFVATYPSL